MIIILGSLIAALCCYIIILNTEIKKEKADHERTITAYVMKIEEIMANVHEERLPLKKEKRSTDASFFTFRDLLDLLVIYKTPHELRCGLLDGDQWIKAKELDKILDEQYGLSKVYYELLGINDVKIMEDIKRGIWHTEIIPDAIVPLDKRMV